MILKIISQCDVKHIITLLIKTITSALNVSTYIITSVTACPIRLAVVLVHFCNNHWGKADDRNCNYGHPKMADVESGKNVFCRLNCFYNVF